MTEPNPVGDQGNTQDPVGGGDSAPNPSAPFKAFATEEDFTAFLAKKTEVYERKMAQLRKEMDNLKAATQSNDEKAAELARQEAEEKYRRDVEAVERRSDVKAVLMSRGLSRDLAVMLSKEAGDEWADPNEAAEDLLKRFSVPLANRQTQPVAGGGGRNPTGADPIQWTPERIQELMDKEGVSGYQRHREEILRWQREHATPGGGPRPLVSKG